MAKGYYLVIQDKTTCGGIITEGDATHTLMGKAIAREQDRVTCGQHPGMYVIVGAIPVDSVNGRKFAGTLHSKSSCPCQAQFIPSITTKTYERSGGATNSQLTEEENKISRTLAVSGQSLDLSNQGGTDESFNEKELETSPPSDALSDFAQHYNVERGDLVYGISQERGKYICAIHPGYQVDNKNHPPMVIDVYNNNISATILVNNLVTTKSNLPSEPKKLIRKLKVPDNLNELVRGNRDGDNYLWSEYFDVSDKNTKFNIKSIFNEVANNYQKDEFHELYTAAPGVMGYAPKLLWKRGSKLGIEMTAQNEATHQLHFILDGLSIQDIVKKLPPHGSSITASELRYAYRNRNRLQGKIHFYQNNKITEAPWVSQPALWSSYIPHEPTPSATQPANKQTKNKLKLLWKNIRRK